MASDEGNDGPSNFTFEITYVIALFCTSIVRGDNGLQCLLNTIATVCKSFKDAASLVFEAQAASEGIVIHNNEESIEWTGNISMKILRRYGKTILPRASVLGSALRFNADKATQITNANEKKECEKRGW